LNRFFSHFAKVIADVVGSWQAFAAAVFVVLAWGLTGFYYGFSNQLYQLVINTGTTIVTFLVVFLLQHTQNKDTLAIQIKLDALIHATQKASDRVMRIEDLSEDQLKAIRNRMPRSA
jgi:low affinity Fe/Cu permease